jgi:hypothetical protein
LWQVPLGNERPGVSVFLFRVGREPTRGRIQIPSDCTTGSERPTANPIWGVIMSYRIIYSELPMGERLAQPCSQARLEEFADEHQALGRARELIETGEHHGVALRDERGDELCGVRLQLKLGFTGE